MKRLRQSRDVLIAHARLGEHSWYLAGGRPAGQACSKAALFGKPVFALKHQKSAFLFIFLSNRILLRVICRNKTAQNADLQHVVK